MAKRLFFVLAVTLLAIYVSTPTFIYFSVPKAERNDAKKVADAIPDWLPETKLVKLGLDLQGGVQLVLGVNTDGAVENKLNRIGTEIARLSEENALKVKSAYVVKGKRILRVDFNPGADLDKLKDELKKQYDGLEQVSRKDDALEFAFSDAQMTRIKHAALEQAERVIRSRVDKWGVSEPLISRRADGSVLVQLPGFSDPDKAKELLGRTAQLQFKMVDDEFHGFDAIAATVPEGISVVRERSVQFSSEDKEKLLAFLKPHVPEDRELLFEEETLAGGKKVKYLSYVVKASTELTGEDIIDSTIDHDRQSLDPKPVVAIQLTGPGGKRFAEITGANVNKRMAIILDNTIVSAPNIQTKIEGGRATITLGTGNYQEVYDEASKLSLILKSGAIPATIEVLEERQVGASLGPELQQQGIYAILSGLFFVLAFMMVYYRRPGIVACVALTLNGLYMIAMMTFFGFSLSLPGIAGFILTLGMAVDANVLINERIRQELREGKNARRAIAAGFEKVFWTIIDANVTTLIAALVLLETSSSGPIKGFAVTLIIGLSVSIFTALYCTKVFFELALRNKTTDAQIRSWCGGDSALKETVFKFDFMSYAKPAAMLGLGLTIAVLVFSGARGLNWAVDFAGGTEIEVAFKEDVDPPKIREAVEKAGVKDVTLQALGGGHTKYLIRFDKGDATDSESSSLSMKVADRIKTELATSGPDIQRVDFVGPQVGKELRVQGALSLLWALIGIFAYIGFRFDMRFSPGAVAKMIQDVFIVLGFYAFFWRSFDLTAIAALLTVIGYSVNDVIVIYDRIRENLILHPRRNLRDNLNTSLNETLTRSLNTSIVTIVSLIGVLIFGTAQIWNFAVAMVVGVVAATFSSTFLASYMVLVFENWKKTRKATPKVA